MTPRAYAAALALSKDENATPAERSNASRRCAEYEALHGKPKVAPGLRPWWTLKIARKDDAFWLGNNRELRNALRALRDDRKQYEYCFEWATVKAVQDGGVDWSGFPDREPWRAPLELLAQSLPSPIRRDEQVMEWQVPLPRRGSPRKTRKLRDGELPGRRRAPVRS